MHNVSKIQQNSAKITKLKSEKKKILAKINYALMHNPADFYTLVNYQIRTLLNMYFLFSNH